MNSRQRKRIRNRLKMIIPVDSVPSIIKTENKFYITITGTITYKNKDGTVITEEKDFYLIE